MWRVDDCFIHGCVFCYWMCQSDVSVTPSRMSFFQLWFFDLSLLVGDKFF